MRQVLGRAPSTARIASKDIRRWRIRCGVSAIQSFGESMLAPGSPSSRAFAYMGNLALDSRTAQLDSKTTPIALWIAQN